MSKYLEYTYDNLIILAHARDETVFFFDFITPQSVVILLTKPYAKRDEQIIRDVIMHKRATLITLNVIETFDKHFLLDNNTKSMLAKYIGSSNFQKIITHDNVARDIDVQNREIFNFVHSLKLPNHYVINYDPLTSRRVNDTVKGYMRRYVSIYQNEKQQTSRMNAYMDTYSKVEGLKRA